MVFAFGFSSAIFSAETCCGLPGPHCCTSHHTVAVTPVPFEFMPITGMFFAWACS